MHVLRCCNAFIGLPRIKNPDNITLSLVTSFVHSVKLFVTHFIADFIAGSLQCLYRRRMESRPIGQTGLIRLLIFDVMERTSSVASLTV